MKSFRVRRASFLGASETTSCSADFLAVTMIRNSSYRCPRLPGATTAIFIRLASTLGKALPGNFFPASETLPVFGCFKGNEEKAAIRQPRRNGVFLEPALFRGNDRPFSQEGLQTIQANGIFKPAGIFS